MYAHLNIRAIDTGPERKVTIGDFCMLDVLLTARASELSWGTDAVLARQLRKSVVMEDSQIPQHVATMRSRVEFRIGESDVIEVATLVYPGERHIFADAISVLTPVGSAILGLAEGQTAYRVGPEGTWSDITILRVLHQPEVARRHKWRLDEKSEISSEVSIRGAQP